MLLLFDIGGTKSRLGLSQDGQTFLTTEIYPTPQTFEQGISLIKDFLTNHNVAVHGAVGGIAGPLNKEKTTLVNAPNMQGWVGKPLKVAIGQAISSENVILENDAALAGVGEAQFGAGKGCSIVSYITIGTGVGGVRIVEGSIDKNAFGFEPGHQIIDIEDGKDLYSLEYFLGGASIKKTTGKTAEEIIDPVFWDEKAFYLAVGLANVTVHWSPECIVLGGSVSQKIPMQKLTELYSQVLKIFPTKPHIKLSSLGELSGLYGALGIGKRFFAE